MPDRATQPMERAGPPLNIYFLSYELHGDAEFSSMREGYVTDFIKKISGAYCRPLKNSWFVASDLPISLVINDLSGYLAAEDRLSVVRVGDACGWHGFTPEDGTWLKQRL